MRILLLTLIAVVLPMDAGESRSPLWDGEESVEQYAGRVGLSPTKALDLGDGVIMEFVLIPAGKFTMGAPPPNLLDEDRYSSDITVAGLIMALAFVSLVALLCWVIWRAVWKQRKAQYSLGLLLFATVLAGVVLVACQSWWATLGELDAARVHNEAEKARQQRYGDNEKPSHQVTISRPFYMGRYEVMQPQYGRLMPIDRGVLPGEQLPITAVSWHDAVEFCAKLSASSGEKVRLPTEAEWEYACRAGTETEYCSGDGAESLNEVGWHAQNSGAPMIAGKKSPNAWCLYDMHGNVWEWCYDWRDSYESLPTVDPRNPEQGDGRVVRGGAADSDPIDCRSTVRGAQPSARRPMNTGFRVVVSVR